MKKISLFTKFTLLILIAAVIIVAITHGALFVYFHKMKNHAPFLENFDHLANFVISQIDINDTTASRTILGSYGIDLRFRSDSFEWSSSTDVPKVETLSEKSIDEPLFRYGRHHISTIERGSCTYVILWRNPFDRFSFPWDIFIVCSGILALTFLLVSLIIRYLLKPVRILQAGVKQISEGNFGINLPQTTTDEFGKLIKSFNNMALQIRNDITARDQLLRDISHELRSPLSRMMVALEFIPEGNSRLVLRNNISILEKMTSSILEEERLDSPFGKIQCEQVNPGKLICEIIEARAADSSLVRVNEIGPTTITADKERIRIALSNVIDNAIKYSRPDSEPVEITTHQEGQHFVIVIQDTGIGIPDSDLPFIFEPFYRVDKARLHSSGGYGLGMSLTKKIIEAHNGSIVIESTPGKGTTVIITLPLL